MDPMRPKWGLMIAIAASMGALWGIDVFLARTERLELSGEARGDYDFGSALLAEGRAADAIDPLRKAQALDRSNRPYALRLAAALMATGKLDEAGRLLADLLERNPNDGETNLTEAHLLVRDGDWENAFAYYHRAIYGSWGSQKLSNALSPQNAARLELADLLAQRGLQKDLLAELLPLETEAGNDPETLRHIARLYLIAGAPARAEAVYRALLRDRADDPDLYSGLGDAELALGNYRAAEAAFQNAIGSGADRNRLEQRIQIAGSVAGLDPTSRRLTSTEKFGRAMRILQLATEALKDCGGNDAGKEIGDAQKLLAERVHGNPSNELAEERLSEAEKIWQMRLSACGPSTSLDEEPLRLLMAKIAQ
jgi:tetratricopeptide (TPR) repeat protein